MHSNGLPPVLLALEPTTLHGGSSVSGTITLTGPSAAGGRNVTMTTTRPDVVAPPPSITVDAGTSAAGFAVPVTPVETRTNVTITASSTATDTQAAVLVVEPRGQIFSPFVANSAEFQICVHDRRERLRRDHEVAPPPGQQAKSSESST